jgi:hypothetical protein
VITMPTFDPILVPGDDDERRALLEYLSSVLSECGMRDWLRDDIAAIDFMLQRIMRYDTPGAPLEDKALAEMVQHHSYGSGRRLARALRIYRFRTKFPTLLDPPETEKEKTDKYVVTKASEDIRTVLRISAFLALASIPAYWLLDAFLHIDFSWTYTIVAGVVALGFWVWYAATEPETKDTTRAVPIPDSEQQAAIAAALRTQARVAALVDKGLILARTIAPFSIGSNLVVLGSAAQPHSVRVRFLVQASYPTVNGQEWEQEQVETFEFVDDKVSDQDLIDRFNRGIKAPLDVAMHKIATKLGIGTGTIEGRDRHRYY